MNNSFRKLGLLASLYVSQGLPFGFFTQTLPVLLRTNGASLPAIGLANLLAAPWALKFLWAPMFDRRQPGRWGKRRGPILLLQGLASLTLLAIGLVTPAHATWAIVVAVVLTNTLAASQDIATDGLAVELLDREERGLGNGVQTAGYRLGMILGGGLLLIVMDRLGWTRTFVGMGAALAVLTVPLLFFREPPRPTAPAAAALRLTEGLRREGIWPWLVLLIVYKSGEYYATGILRAFLVDRGLTLADVGTLLGTVGFTAGLVGSMLGGFAVNRLGRRRSLITFGLLQAVSVAGYAYVATTPSMTTLYLVSTVEHLASGLATTALFTVMMDACRPSFAATDYTVQSCAVVIANGVASAASGFSAQHFGYPLHFLLGAGLCLLGSLYVVVLRPGRGAFWAEPHSVVPSAGVAG